MPDRKLDTLLDARELDVRNIRAAKCSPDCEYCSANEGTIKTLLAGRTFGYDYDRHLSDIKDKQAAEIGRLETALRKANDELADLRRWKRLHETDKDEVCILASYESDAEYWGRK